MNYTYEMAPRPKGMEDNADTRMQLWEEKQGIQMSKLTREEWIDVVYHILPITRQEAEEWLNCLVAKTM